MNVQAPENLKDSNDLLSEDGFATSNIWYHGTTSGLSQLILEEGLKRSGDHEINQITKKTMATIGNKYTERKEPVFLTQSKELAYYWAAQKVRTRQVHTGQEETPVIIQATLDAETNNSVKPDVGAAVMLLDLNPYMGYLEEIYHGKGLEFDLDALQENVVTMDRNDYLNKLGLAYYQGDIPKDKLAIVE